MPKTLITAHSGAGQTPDNSMENVNYVLLSEADAMELDIRRNHKGELALGHDEVDGNSVLLEEVLRRLADHPTLMINCDLKESGLDHDVIELAEQYGVSSRLMLSGSTQSTGSVITGEHLLLVNAESLVPNWQQMSPEACVEALKEALLGRQVDALNIHHAWFDVLKGEEGLPPLSLWTVNDPDLLHRYLQAEVFNITTRIPEDALRIRREVQG